MRVKILWQYYFIATRCHHRNACLPLSVTLTFHNSLQSSGKSNSKKKVRVRGKKVFNHYCLTGQSSFALCSPLYTIVPQNSLLHFGCTDSFCRVGIKILKWLIEIVHSSFGNRLFKCSHPYYCQSSDGYQMNGALYLICTGPLQLNQNQHVFNEFDKTDAM